MKCIIAGTRSYTSHTVLRAVYAAIEACPWSSQITEVVSGTARGVDRAGEQWAKAKNIPLRQFPANWDLHGKRAGFVRNEEMADYADALVAVWDGQSRGTKHMILSAEKRGLKVFVYRTDAEYNTR